MHGTMNVKKIRDQISDHQPFETIHMELHIIKPQEKKYIFPWKAGMTTLDVSP